MLWYHLRVIFKFLKSVIFMVINSDPTTILRFNGDFTTNTMRISDINYHVKELK